jgi:hypothetical protein
MRQFLLIAVVCLISPAIVRADGGTVRISERQGEYQITAFTSPTPFRAGPVDISVLVQNATDGEAAADVHVVVRIAPVDRPDEALTEVATTAAATNKLFRSALFELPAPGRWQVNVAVEGPSGPAEAHFELEAGEPLPHWLAIWPWIGWPVVAIALFGVHQFLVCRRIAAAFHSTKAIIPKLAGRQLGERPPPQFI